MVVLPLQSDLICVELKQQSLIAQGPTGSNSRDRKYWHLAVLFGATDIRAQRVSVFITSAFWAGVL